LRRKKIDKKLIFAATGVLILVAVLIYYFYSRDPSDKENIYVGCAFKGLTGLDCPGCGGQRSVHHLLHLEIIQALRYNAFFILLIPYLVLLSYYEIRRFFWEIPKPENFFTSNKMLWVFLISLLVFGIIRNLPFYPFSLLGTPD